MRKEVGRKWKHSIGLSLSYSAQILLKMSKNSLKGDKSNDTKFNPAFSHWSIPLSSRFPFKNTMIKSLIAAEEMSSLNISARASFNKRLVRKRGGGFRGSTRKKNYAHAPIPVHPTYTHDDRFQSQLIRIKNV
jgi:hypothetical protein